MAEHKIRFKKIIDGRTYNTETSVLLAKRSNAGNPETAMHPESGQILFQTRHGAYFLYDFDDGRDPWEDDYKRIIPLDPERAQRWVEKYCSADDVEAIFGRMPDAGEAEAKVTLRMPEILRRRLAAMAESRGQSMNAAIIRCLEGCVMGADKRG